MDIEVIIMFEGIPDNVLDYPLVQYIPLRLYDLKEGKHNFLNTNLYLSIYKPDEENKLNQKLTGINFDYTNYNIDENQLAILIFNGYVNIIKYRAHEVFMIGNQKNKNVRLFKVTTRYFYKDRLIFSLYNDEDGNRIKRKPVRL